MSFRPERWNFGVPPVRTSRKKPSWRFELARLKEAHPGCSIKYSYRTKTFSIPKEASVSFRRCSHCSLEKPKTEEFWFKRTDRPWLFLSKCRECRNKIRNEHRFKRYDLYLKQLRTRNAVRAKRCAVCHTRGELQLYDYEGTKSLYHATCARDVAIKLGVVTWERRRQLDAIAMA